MRDAIRGSTALPNAMRLVVGVWAAHDYERRMKAMGIRPARATLFRAGVVKANMPEALGEPKTLMRDAVGLLQDVTAMDQQSRGARPDQRAWLIWAVTQAREQRAPFAKTGANGIFARRAQLPPMFHQMTRAEFETVCDDLLTTGGLVMRAPENSGKNHNYLDGADYAETTLWLDTKAALSLKWQEYFYDAGWDEIRRKVGSE